MPAPFLHGSPPPESLADHIRDLANQFSTVAAVLADQYTSLNNATSGLLDGTYPWQGKGASSFFTTWENFGTYMQTLQQSCEATYNSLVKLSNKIEDVEGEEAWNFLLMVVGGIATVISFAAAIAELGLDPFVDGFTALLSTFTEQEGNDVANISEEITEADAETASELQEIEDDLTSSPEINAGINGPSDDGAVPPALAPTQLDEMSGIGTKSIFDEMTPDDWEEWVDNETAPYDPQGKSLAQMGPDADGEPYPQTCVPDCVKMLLDDNGNTQFSDQEIMDNLGYNPDTGVDDPNDIAAGMRKMGFPDAAYQPGMDDTQLQNLTSGGKPTIVIINQTTDPDASNPTTPHAVIVDGIEGSGPGAMVEIRDPFFNPPRAYQMPMWAFNQVWQFGGISY
jgi:uncharacterized protein YukE